MSDEHSHPEPSEVLVALRELYRAWQALSWLAYAASFVVGREGAYALLDEAQRPIKHGLMQEMEQMRISLLECEPRNKNGKGDPDEVTKLTEADRS